MELTKLDKASEIDCKFFEELYLDSFPSNERRSLSKLYRLYSDKEPYVINLVKDNDQNIGFITHWEFSDFIFAEHFSINKQIRNAGYGGLTIDAFLAIHTKPIMLEVEMPTDDLSIRRIGFYQRKGFKLWGDVEYAQPSFVEGEGDVPMFLLTYGYVENEKDLASYVHEMHAKIFGRKY